MARESFTPEELEILRANPYTLKEEPGTIKFTYAFKVAFWEKYQANPHPASKRSVDQLTPEERAVLTPEQIIIKTL